jgi:hypothetical protein
MTMRMSDHEKSHSRGICKSLQNYCKTTVTSVDKPETTHRAELRIYPAKGTVFRGRCASVCSANRPVARFTPPP